MVTVTFAMILPLFFYDLRILDNGGK